MAIYSNFEGTLKSSIMIGKKGPRLVNEAGTLKLVDKDNILLPFVTATPTNDEHAATKGYIDNLLGGGDVVNDTYVKLSQINLLPADITGDVAVDLATVKATKLPYLDGGDKIHVQFMPDVATSTYTASTIMERNALLARQGDIVIILPPKRLEVGVELNQGDYVLADAVNGVYYKYIGTVSATVTSHMTVPGSAANPGGGEPVGHPDTDTVSWASDDKTVGDAITAGEVFLYGNELFVPYADSTLTAGMPGSANSSYLDIGDLARTDVYSHIPHKIFGSYILNSIPDGGTTVLDSGITTNDKWTFLYVAEQGVSVTTFKGRTGDITPQFADYSANQILTTAFDDITGISVQAHIADLAAKRVKKAGDVMSGALAFNNIALDGASQPIAGQFGSATSPSIKFGTSTSKTGLYAKDQTVIVTTNGVDRFKVGNTTATMLVPLNMSSQKITGVLEPTVASDAATKSYVDAKPTIITTTSSVGVTGKIGDLSVITTPSDVITTNSAATWTSIAGSNGQFFAVNSNTNSSTGTTSTTGGKQWTASSPGTGTASFTFDKVVSNNTLSFVASRTALNASNKVRYTVNGGSSWTDSSGITIDSSYILCDVQQDGTPYLMVDKSSTNAYYSVRGMVWEPITVATSKQWVAGAGANGNYVVVAADGTVMYGSPTSGTPMANTTTLPAGFVKPRSITTYDGTTFFIVGYNDGGSSANVYISTDAGATWVSKFTLQTSRWHSVIATPFSVVAIGYNTDKAMYSTNNGTTWTMVTLPSTGFWGDLAFDGEKIIAVNIGSNTATPFVVSDNNGVTWRNQNIGEITEIRSCTGTGTNDFISLKTAASVDNLYVKKTGSVMTGALTILGSTEKTGLNVSGGIAAASLDAVTFQTSSAINRIAGHLHIGASNSNSVSDGKIYNWEIDVEGNNTGYHMCIASTSRGGADRDEFVRFDDTGTSFKKGIAVGESNVNVGLLVKPGSVGSLKHGIIIDGKDAPNSGLVIAGYAGTTGNALTVLGNCSTADYSQNTTALMYPGSSEAFVINSVGRGQFFANTLFGYASNANAAQVDVKHGNVIGGPAAPARTRLYGVRIDSSALPSDVAGQRALFINSPTTEEASYKHIEVKSGTDVIFNVGTTESVLKGTFKPETVHCTGTSSMKVPVGTDSQRPVGSEGELRGNSDDNTLEYHNGTEWVHVQLGESKYKVTVARTSWIIGASTSTYTIAATTHKLGTDVYVAQLLELTGGAFKPTMMDYEVDVDGNLKLIIPTIIAAEIPDSLKVFIHN